MQPQQTHVVVPETIWDRHHGNPSLEKAAAGRRHRHEAGRRTDCPQALGDLRIRCPVVRVFHKTLKLHAVEESSHALLAATYPVIYMLSQPGANVRAGRALPLPARVSVALQYHSLVAHTLAWKVMRSKVRPLRGKRMT